ncbi:hypothetical protein [Hydrogenimonas thermophila]|uniref:DUF3828 domain-containing protein n=1 Tax=Hydrogenimonas thermophila TaxID=223786 RepID=A0A1I5P8W0_9BACT|nr:hypothetical protein [Hydrogenimonas thermophila]WOE69641.1 hypothetical protein RZR91_11105 [Hydrogenimonas thermophila]WOE72155.1 hypothetical protein RZR97_11095 [Hydrogenimonas thermophila]SFP30403.1 hypothetical protein SAMN05216234_11420 [Hydrogenimonas thermophila]
MKILIIVFLFVQMLFAVEFDFKVPLESSLQESFKRYWSLKESESYDLKTLYKMELPYLRYLNPIKKYKLFVPPLEIKKVEVTKIFKNRGDKVELGAWLYNFDEEKSYFHDIWVKMDDKWYHRFIDKILPF